MWWGIWLGCGTFVPWVEPTGAELTRITVFGADVMGASGGEPVSGVEVTADLDVHNPWWSPFTVDELAWSMTIGGTTLTAGELQKGVFVRPNGITRVRVPLTITWADFRAATASLAGPEVPYTLDLYVHATTAGGPWEWPVHIEGALPRFSAPTIDLVDWSTEVQGSALAIDVVVKVGLPEGFALHDGRWRLSVDDHRLGEGRFASRPDGPLHLPLVVDAGGTGAAGWSWLTGEARSLRFDLEGAIVTPAGIVPLEVHQAFPVGGTAD